MRIPEEKAFALLKRYGIPVVPQVFCSSPSSVTLAVRKIGFPCVMKAVGPLHKTDVGGVVLDVRTEEEAEEVFRRLLKIRGCEKVLVQKQLRGVELMVGGVRDGTFGSFVSFGLGGIYVEMLSDVSFRLCPVTEGDAEAMMKETAAWRILSGARGRKYPVEELKRIIVSASNLMVRCRLAEMDVNPLIATENGFFAADVRMRR